MEQMNEDKAKEILKEWIVGCHSCLYSMQYPYVDFKSGKSIRIDGYISLEKVQALAWWMENKGGLE